MSKGQRFRVTVGDREHEVQVASDHVLVDGERLVVTPLPDLCTRVEGDGDRRTLIHLDREGSPSGASVEGVAVKVVVSNARTRRRRAQGGAAADGILRAPMPGRVIKIVAAPGLACQRGDQLFVVEAMKMENELPSPCTGVVKTVKVSVGDAVDAGQPLCEIEPG